MLYCVPNYKPRYKSIKPTTLHIYDWNENEVQNLHGCTDWNCLYDENASIDWNTTVFTKYVKFCINMHVIKKMLNVLQITIPGNI